METELECVLAENVEGVWEIGVDAIIESSGEERTKQDYVDSIVIGVIVAFKINNDKMLSGMVSEIHEFEYVVKTKNGISFSVNKKNIVWVKTGSKWPKGILIAWKGERKNG